MTAESRTRFTDDERRFLGEATRTGKIAWVASDGRPLVTAIWFVLDGDDVVFTTDSGSAKGKAILRDPRVAVLVDLETPPYGFVQIQGTASVSEDLDDLLVWATKIGGRYMGAERAEEFGRRNGVAGELLVRVRPERIIGNLDVTA